VLSHLSGLTTPPPTSNSATRSVIHTETIGSLHMILHTKDSTTIVETGWGERHLLTRGSWYWRTWHRALRRVGTDQRPTRPPVPEYLCFIYVPRSEEELEVIELLLNAVIWFATSFDYDTGARTEDVLEREWLPAPPPPRRIKNTMG
jgi:hypothetical protein